VIAEQDLAYVAGLFDGEGCVTVSRHQTTTAFTHQAQITITNTDREILEWVQGLFGLGSIQVKPSYSDRHSAGYTWVASSRQARDFLLAVSPYLRVKRQQANLALALQQSIEFRRANRRDRLTADDLRERDGFWSEIKRLNTRRRPVLAA
jgi:hypothetical protein